jgi:hypothetical protein
LSDWADFLHRGQSHYARHDGSVEISVKVQEETVTTVTMVYFGHLSSFWPILKPGVSIYGKKKGAEHDFEVYFVEKQCLRGVLYVKKMI